MAKELVGSLGGAIGAGLSGRCPHCGRGKLFSGFLTVRPRCDICGLNYGFADSGDGPAVFVMFFAGFIVVGAALITEAVYHPPYWVHAAQRPPLILLHTLRSLQSTKARMIAMQYRSRAEERFGGSGVP